MLKVKGIFYFYLLLISFSFSTFAGTYDFPDIKLDGLTPKQKTYLLRDLHQFIKEYEKKQQGRYSSIEEQNFHLLNQFIESAYALDPKNACLYGGWPSERNDTGYCIWPQDKSPSYQKYDGKCVEGQLYCNPVLFGQNICVPFATNDERNSAYQNCNAIFRRLERNLDDVVAQADGGEFNELLSTAKNACTFGKQAGTGMCISLINKLKAYTDVGTSKIVEQLIQAKNSKDADHIVQALNSAGDRLNYLQERLNKECGKGLAESDDEEYKKFWNGLSVSEKQKCLDLANEFNELQEYLQELLNQIEADDPELHNEIMCGVNLEPIIEVQQSDELEEIVEEVQCSEEEIKKSRTSCLDDVGCAVMSDMLLPLSIFNDVLNKKQNSCLSSDNSCLVNAVTAMLKNITDLVTGLWDLAAMGVEYVGEKIGEGWNWLWGIEDKTSEAQNDLAGMNPEQIKEMEENPGKWYERLWSGIKTSFNSFMVNHIGCEKYAGVPHYSECLKPFKGFDCMSCKTYITGACTAVGYIAPEILSIVGTGGLSSLLKGGAKSASIIMKGVKASEAFRTFAKTPAAVQVAKAYGKVSKGVKVTVGGVKTATKYVGSKVGALGRFGTKIIQNGLNKFMNSTEVYMAKKLIAKMSGLTDVVVKGTGKAKKLVLKQKDMIVNSKTTKVVIDKTKQVVDQGKMLTIKAKNSLAKKFDVEIDLAKQTGRSIKSGYKKFERMVNDPLYKLSDDMVAGSQRLANRIEGIVPRTGTVVGLKGVKAANKALKVEQMQTKYYSKVEVDDYFDSFSRKAPDFKTSKDGALRPIQPNKDKFYMEFLQDLGENYPKMTSKELDELKNMMYNIHKTCNPVWPSKVITPCKKRMLATFKRHLKDKYPKLDPKHVNNMSRADVRILGEVPKREIPDFRSMETTELMTQKNLLKKFDINETMNLGEDTFEEVIDYHVRLYQEAEVLKAGASPLDIKQFQAMQDNIKDWVEPQLKTYAKNKKLNYPEINWGKQSNADDLIKMKRTQEVDLELNKLQEKFKPEMFNKRLEDAKVLPIDEQSDALRTLMNDTGIHKPGSYGSDLHSLHHNNQGYISDDFLAEAKKSSNKIYAEAEKQFDEVQKAYQRKNALAPSYKKYRRGDDSFSITRDRKNIDQMAESMDDPKLYKKNHYSDVTSELSLHKSQLSNLKEMANKGQLSDKIVQEISGDKGMTVKKFIKNLDDKIEDATNEINFLEKAIDDL